MNRRALIIASVLFLAAWGPFLILPGGALEGEVVPVPADWSFTDAISTIQLETQPADPYSVNIWITAAAGDVYIHAGANRATWVEHLEQNPDVRLRVGEKIYLLRAERVREAAEFARFANAYERKYDRRPRNENVAEAYLFRLVPR